jgi:hypothetical protein
MEVRVVGLSAVLARLCADAVRDALRARERAARLLEVQPTASRAVVEAASKRLATLNHPDKGSDEELMKQLTRARDLLLQPR